MLTKIGEALADNGVIMHACPESAAVLPEAMTKAATKNTFRREYLGLEISVKVVSSLKVSLLHTHIH
jgi:gamma-glutamyl phosphate reductase